MSPDGLFSLFFQEDTETHLEIMKSTLLRITAIYMVSIGMVMCKSKLKPPSEYFDLCHKNDLQLNDCIAKSIRKVKPDLIKGIPDLKIMSIDPFQIEKMIISEGGGNIQLSSTNTNVTFIGLKDFTLSLVKFDNENKTLEMHMQVPFVSMTSDYEMDGKILLLSVSGKGDQEFIFKNLSLISKTKGELERRNGKDYLKITEVKWSINPGFAHFQINNLFNGDATLGKAVNDFLNENWKEAIKTYIHLAEEAFNVMFENLINRVVNLFPWNELLLD